MFRFPTRWAGDDPFRARLALLMLLCLRGTPVLYQGDEIGMTDTTLAQEDLRDPLGVRYYPYYEGRDAGRTPVHWSPAPGGGFTAVGVRPWLPLGDVAAVNVADQREDPDSMLQLARRAIAYRRDQPDLWAGSYETLPGPEGIWAWCRGDRHTVVCNMTDGAVELPSWRGTVVLATDRRREGDVADGLLVAASEGLVLLTS
jgi:alpha-glucosidase